jgi:hypothetical protein
MSIRPIISATLCGAGTSILACWKAIPLARLALRVLIWAERCNITVIEEGNEYFEFQNIWS